MTKVILFDFNDPTHYAEKEKRIMMIKKLREGGITIHTSKFTQAETGFEAVDKIWIEFENDEDAVMFKLTYL